MNILNAKTLPAELIAIADYYAGQSKRPFDLLSMVSDPEKLVNSSGYDDRARIMGEYREEPHQIYLYLGRIIANHRAIQKLPPGLGHWFAILEVFLHEMGHHLQRENRFYCDDYSLQGYWDCWPERDARRFAYEELHRLADLDENLFAPKYTKDLGYLGVNASRMLESYSVTVWDNPDSWKITNLLRSARLRAIHVPKFVFASRRVNKTKQILVLDPNFCQDGFLAPEIDEGFTEWGETPEVFNDEYVDGLDTQNPDVNEAWVETIPESPNIEEEFLASSGLVAKNVTYQTYKSVAQKNPYAILAEREGILWADRRGRVWRYLRLGQAFKYGMLG